jgi:hypothetical protein
LSDADKRRQRNCDSKKSNPAFHLDWAPELRRCPKAAFTQDIWTAVGWWIDWKEYGVLPYDGDMAAQPAFVSQAISACQREMRVIEAELMRKARSQTPNQEEALSPGQPFRPR